MAQIILSEAGAAAGRALLPQGLSLLGAQVSGAVLGRAAGSLLGGLIDAHLAPPAEGPRISALPVMASREGVGIASVYGRMRVAGQVIWASRFREQKTTRSAGSKGGPRVTEYAYTVSLAVALGEGPVTSVQRAWANGEAFDLSQVTYRFYAGDEAQEADPLVGMIEGGAPAYRGMAYVVFEDLPLDGFGNRIPQLSFEIVRVPPGAAPDGLGAHVTGVNIIPASGEFVYATEIVRERLRAGRERPLNANSGEARADFLVSLDQMEADLPLVARAALVAGWFGSDVSAGACEIRPGVETRERVTVPQVWSVAGIARADSYLVSRNEDDRPNYGGTPSDACVKQAIAELKARGIAVTFSPFLFMDCEGFPWRGRVTVSADGTAAARSEIDQFVNGATGFRHFILHYAALCAEAGGVEAFLIGSEMIGLTRVRDEAGAFPFVEALVALAAEVKAILAGAKVSYAADWTEYGAYAPGDGSGDVLFPLDALWASPDVDFVGIDWYPPMGDWRNGTDHLDAQAGYAGPDDPDYLAFQIAGGEAYDWYYASEADRAAQVRTPITDTAHGEDWVFRAKDLAGWAGNAHCPRPGGVRTAVPTAWVPGSKPVRLCEIGFAAVDKGGNAPNLFYDPKSSESALPPYSTGARDDVFQRRALAVTLAHWEADPLVEAALVWAWDGRPFPAWPLREDVWGDGANWARGHWLNGRAGLAPLADVVGDICARGGVADVDASALDGVVQGFQLNGVCSVRAALEPLKAAFGFEAVERNGGIVFRMEGDGALHSLAGTALGEDGLVRTRQLLDKAPQRLRVTHVDAGADFGLAIAEARTAEGDVRLVADFTLPLALSAAEAEAVAGRLLRQAASAESAELSLPLSGMAIEPGDAVQVDGGALWRVDDVTDRGALRLLSLKEDIAAAPRVRAVEAGRAPVPATVFGAADLVLIDGPRRPGEAAGLRVAAWADPWPGTVRVLAGLGADAMRERAVLDRPAVLGTLLEAVPAGPVGRWDRANTLHVEVPDGAFASLPEGQVLSGGNLLLLETEAGWEMVQFRTAALTGPEEWILSGLLRGQQGSVSAAAPAGARVLLLDGSDAVAAVSADEIGSELTWRAAGADDGTVLAFEDRGGLPWPVAHLQAADGTLSWTRRGADLPESWALPEGDNTGRFAVSFDMGSGFGDAAGVAEAAATIPSGAVAARVAEIGADGRIGPWVSIGLGTP
ncbi:MAG TPA: glycoside hydrolase/phage tail family protein [Hyphomonas sp.]|nr:glycoside hydrolase/phage tail family protein [Hyphomonas sp.]MCA8903331.1 glycoside hydrolase/phage tail family protein [Hyphomonas sp.]MCB9962248.1 glycoside hydrolase/phage tail family protein [Hyphomonas sp.]HPE46906.1 glycoside hydrolase/phage tail family protein [Hyphomonas sp.]